MGNWTHRIALLGLDFTAVVGNLPAQVLNMSHDLVTLGIAPFRATSSR
jgi:hypothetical protein